MLNRLGSMFTKEQWSYIAWGAKIGFALGSFAAIRYFLVSQACYDTEFRIDHAFDFNCTAHKVYGCADAKYIDQIVPLNCSTFADLKSLTEQAAAFAVDRLRDTSEVFSIIARPLIGMLSGVAAVAVTARVCCKKENTQNYVRFFNAPRDDGKVDDDAKLDLTSRLLN